MSTAAANFPSFFQSLGFIMPSGQDLQALSNQVIVQLNTQAGTVYVLQPSDNNKVLVFGSASGVVVTVPKGLGPFQCGIVQAGAGQVTLSASPGVLLESRLGFSKTAGQWALLSVLTYAQDSFVLAGDGA